MDDSVIRLRAFGEEYLKIAEELTARDVARKYPHLVAKSARPELQALAEKKAGVLTSVGSGLRRFGEGLHKHEDAIELAGLGALAVPGLDTMQAHVRAGAGASEHQVAQKRLLSENTHAGADVGGLGVLAAPIIAGKLLGKKVPGHT